MCSKTRSVLVSAAISDMLMFCSILLLLLVLLLLLLLPLLFITGLGGQLELGDNGSSLIIVSSMSMSSESKLLSSDSSSLRLSWMSSLMVPAAAAYVWWCRVRLWATETEDKYAGGGGFTELWVPATVGAAFGWYFLGIPWPLVAVFMEMAG